jgi:hypothetical protein
MTDYQLKNLIYMLYCNDPKLRQLSKDGYMTMQDLWRLQELAVNYANEDELLTKAAN